MAVNRNSVWHPHYWNSPAPVFTDWKKTTKAMWNIPFILCLSLCLPLNSVTIKESSIIFLERHFNIPKNIKVSKIKTAAALYKEPQYGFNKSKKEIWHIQTIMKCYRKKKSQPFRKHQTSGIPNWEEIFSLESYGDYLEKHLHTKSP